MGDAIDIQRRLLQGLLDPRAYPHPAGHVEHIETHISHILLAGEHAYKIKKPIDLGFLDYRGLSRRRRFCAEELRLNRRTAPGIYLDVVGISGRPDAPHIVAQDAAGCLEYAVHMRRFERGTLLSEQLTAGGLDAAMIDRLAQRIAAFHHAAASAGRGTPWGDPEQVHRPVRDNFRMLEGHVDGTRLRALRDWAEQRYQALRTCFQTRRQAGRVRECHGDLHLGNIVLWQGEPCPFDGIEFNEALRWIDVINDTAFLMMDLEDRGRPGLAWRLLNRYLEFSGDYPGVAVLDYYRAYRAMVRAKVAAIRLDQHTLGHAERAQAAAELDSYLTLAETYTRPPRPCLLLTSGLSGSGKTWLSQHLLQSLGLIRLRSDVERKRLYGLGPLEHSDSALGAGIYTAEAGRRTYARLLELAGEVLDTGHPVVVDATFLEHARRAPFIGLAQQRRVPVLILRCEADIPVLHERILRRAAGEKDASEAGLQVLEGQLMHWQGPHEEEGALTLAVDTNGEIPMHSLLRQVRERLGLGTGSGAQIGREDG